MPELHDLGEEYLIKNGADGDTFDVGLYNTSDSLTDSDDLAAVTTEPSGSAYARQNQAFSAEDVSGDWQVNNDSTITFDTSDSSETVDGYIIVKNFQASDTGDSSATDHLVASGDLSQQFNLDDGQTNIEQLDINQGTAGISIN